MGRNPPASAVRFRPMNSDVRFTGRMEQVYVKNEYYDGPRRGIANYNGVPHRFIANFDDLNVENDTFRLFPVLNDEFSLEIEQWKIYVEWDKKYESGELGADTHPGHGGIDKRWDEIEKILQPKRDIIPESAIEVYAEFKQNDQESRYTSIGPNYGVAWKPADQKT